MQSKQSGDGSGFSLCLGVFLVAIRVAEQRTCVTVDFHRPRSRSLSILDNGLVLET
jgi:hypothetical protein